MDYQKILQQIQEGSIAQRKRKQQLDDERKKLLQSFQRKQDPKLLQKVQETMQAQLLYHKKIKEGNRNNLRTLKMRLFFAHFQNKIVHVQLKSVVDLMKEFEIWLAIYKTNIQSKDWGKEEACNKSLEILLDKYEKKKKEIEQLLKKETEIKNKATLMLALLILTTTLLLFKETRRIKYNKEIFSEQRYNPLNPFFPFKL
jgi:hypothetical protein